MGGAYLGEFEELTLLAVKAIGEPTYGVPVQQYVERAAGRAVSMGDPGRLDSLGTPFSPST